MTAALEAIRSMRFFAANTADISVDDLLLRDSERFYEMHEKVKCLLDMKGTAFEEKSLCIDLYFNKR